MSKKNTLEIISTDANSTHEFSNITQKELNALASNTDKEEYDMNHKNRGLALIFNHEHFDKVAQRHGTKKDCQDIEKCLKLLKFDVKVCQDYTYSEIMNEIKWAKKQDHTKNDCLLIVIMSHGDDDDDIYAKDKKYQFPEIWNAFTPDNCPTLTGKPKLFFIQACRGNHYENAKLIKKTQTDGLPSLTRYSIPIYADFLLCYSTMPSFYSWRNVQSGSWFIQSLCLELENNYKEYDLLTILTFVFQDVAIKFETGEFPKMRKQMPCMDCMLTKILYFRDKNTS